MKNSDFLHFSDLEKYSPQSLKQDLGFIQIFHLFYSKPQL